ncbi:MAG: hypothetical protein Q6361_00900, partial [Candidatus Hermodarchaeota archaeon]|nr:hypothetical protein [Candidatus Hermodarchaeota archaeon]
QYAADFILTLIERLGYQQVRIVDDSAKAMKGLIAVFELIQRGYKGALAFQELATQAGSILVQAQQREDQTLIDIATVYRWLCEGAGSALRVISLKLVSDIYRVGIISDVLDVGSKEELRQRIINLLELAEEDDLFGMLLDAEVEFDDVADLFKSLELFWVAAICKLNQGQLRQNLSFLELKLVPPELADQEAKISGEGIDQVIVPFWGAAPSIDFITAADLYSLSFRLKRGVDETHELKDETSIDSWIPHRDPDDIRRRAAYSHWLSGLASLEEGNIEDGGRQLFLAKNAYELLDRHREAIACLEVWMRQLVRTITGEETGGARPTQARLEEVLTVTDELVGLYALRRTTANNVDDILGIVSFLQNQVGMENWTLSVYMRTIEYVREAIRIALQLGTPESALEVLRMLREELRDFLDSDFAIGIYPNFDTETTVYFEAETPVKLAILNVSEKEAANLTIRPMGVLPNLSPSTSEPWKTSRDTSQVTMKHFYIGCDDVAFDIDDEAYHQKPADAFGPPYPVPVALATSPTPEEEPDSPSQQIITQQPWLGIMWTGDYNGSKIGNLVGLTEEPPSPETIIPSLDELTQSAFFTVFTKSAREGNILPGQIFPVTFGIYHSGSDQPIAIQTVFF